MSLATLAAVKAFKNLDTDEHDAELLRLLDVVTAFIETHCHRTFREATVTEYHSPLAGAARLFLKRPPITSITSVHDDPDRIYGSGTLVPAAQYVLEDPGAGLVAFDKHTLAGGLKSVQVVYVGGFAVTPFDLEQAAVELAWLTRDLGDKALLGVAAKQIADGSITTYQRSRLDAVREWIEPYRLRRVG